MITWVSNVSIVLVTSSYLLFTLDMRTVYAELTQQPDLFVFVKDRPITEIGWFVCVAFSVGKRTPFSNIYTECKTMQKCM